MSVGIWTLSDIREFLRSGKKFELCSCLNSKALIGDTSAGRYDLVGKIMNLSLDMMCFRDLWQQLQLWPGSRGTELSGDVDRDLGVITRTVVVSQGK